VTTLIKNAAGKLLKAEGKLWDQNSVEDCDCPCYSVVDCDDLIDLKRINIKCTGWWGLEWTLTHPGGEYVIHTVYGTPPGGITAAAYSSSGSFLLKIPPLVKSWDYEKASIPNSGGIGNSIIIDNWFGLEISHENCYTLNEDIYANQLIQIGAGNSAFGISASFPSPGIGGTRIFATTTHQLDYHADGTTWRKGNTYHLPVSIFKQNIGNDTATSTFCGLPCCDDITESTTDWAPTALGRVQIGIPANFQYPPETDFYDDYVLTYTEHTPVFTHELKGTD